MFTVCPKCTLTLVVTTVDLRAGQGYVRCGRCANVFNALIALREGDPAGATSDSANRRLQETTPQPSVAPAVGSGVALDPEPEPEPQAPAEPEPAAADAAEDALEFDPVATDVSDIFITPPGAEHDAASGSYEAVVLSEEVAAEEPPLETPEPSFTDTIASEDWSLLDDEPPAELVVQPPTPDEPAANEDPVAAADAAWVQEMFAEAEAEARHRRHEHITLSAEPPSGPDEDPPALRAARDVKGVSAPSGDTVLEPLLAGPIRTPVSWQVLSGTVALALLLLLQVLHFNRQSLALSPTFGPLASRVYGWFGVVLVPRWDLTAYSVTQLGADAEGADGTRLRVRLSVHNESARVQPLPLLRLTLEDRYGNPVATRDLEPREYLPPRAANQRLLEPDQRIDAELHVMDPGKAAIGFQIDACLRGASGNIGCANEARNRTAG